MTCTACLVPILATIYHANELICIRATLIHFRICCCNVGMVPKSMEFKLHHRPGMALVKPITTREHPFCMQKGRSDCLSLFSFSHDSTTTMPVAAEPTLSAIRIYPVKSCHCVQLEECEIGALGPKYDRRFMFIEESNKRFITQR